MNIQTLEGLFIGTCTEDIMMQVDAVPTSNQRITASAFTRCCGGVAANAAAAFRHLGGECGVISAIGEDSSGDFIRTDLKKQKYAYLNLYTFSDCPSSISAIYVEKDGNRAITHFGGSIARLTFDSIDKSALASARVVHIGALGEECMLETARYVKANCRGLVSIDGGNLTKELINALLPYCDIFIPDDVTVRCQYGLGPMEACRYFREKGVQFTCVTAGVDGCYAFDTTGEYRIPAMKVRVVDTTAAGDNFHGAFLYAYIRNWDTETCLRFSSTFASFTCRAMGGREGMPDRDEVLKLIKQQ